MEACSGVRKVYGRWRQRDGHHHEGGRSGQIRRSDSFDKRGSGKNGFPQPRFLVVKSSYIVIASDPALAGERACTPKCVTARRRGNPAKSLRGGRKSTS